ncbi:peptide deformylase [Pelagibius marinus]|uniref:peptide deformylase n=1 Tax=Pelagibius marinus TaxID=2762760 RepID=UPI001872E764|nr:peptide deformylase [Pelagibius marinus]
MAILKIARMGHPVLRQKAAPVADPSAPEITALVRDMLETMDDAGGTGLAAPQVHVPLRVVVFFVSGRRAAAEEGSGAGREDVPLTVLINPVIEPLTDELALGPEACLSVPGLVGQVPRVTRIRYRGLSLEGAPIEREAAGFHARVVQHECDHLDGILYPQRMTDLSLLAFTSEAGREPLDGGAEEAGRLAEERAESHG